MEPVMGKGIASRVLARWFLCLINARVTPDL